MLGDPGTGRADRALGPLRELVSVGDTMPPYTQVPVALENNLLKYFSNAEAARIKFLLDFYFPPLYLVLLGASMLVGLIQQHTQK